MFSRFFRVAVLFFGAMVVSGGNIAHAATFTPQQRDEVVSILRDALKHDPSILRDAVVALEADDGRKQADAQLGKIAALNSVLTKTAGDPFAGNPNGRVTVVEFYDVRCPFCRRMLPTLAALLQKNPDVKLIYKDMPVLGPASVLGAKALLAAQKQGGYQKLHDAIMTGPADVTEDSLHAAATRLDLDWRRLQADMTAPDVLARINDNLVLSRKLELQGTPAYVIGNVLLPGAVELAELQTAVNTARN